MCSSGLAVAVQDAVGLHKKETYLSFLLLYLLDDAQQPHSLA